jgi:hypothetical protein
MNNQRPKFKRSDNPPAMRFQERDVAILQAIHDFDGVLARRHIKQMFWSGKSSQAMETRLSKLYHNGYLDWPDEEQRRFKPIPEPLVWLGWRGAMIVAREKGIDVPPLTRKNENQMRLLQANLRKHGIRWLREPNWYQAQHDLAVVDFRMAVERSVSKVPYIALERWILESEFRAEPDRIEFTFKGNKGTLRKKAKGVCPDGFFCLIDKNRRTEGAPYKARFLLEMDMATHDNPSFGIEKAAAGAAYIKSDLYRQRFGANAGRWLIVTTSEIRMKNLMRQTKQRVKRFTHLFFFTTLDQLGSENILTDPIWQQVDDGDTKSLIG